MIIIVDYGMGNLRSVQKAFERIKVNSKITDDLAEIKDADRILLPGVGHFAAGMKNLRERGFIEILNKKVVEEKVPVLGICLGMQLMTRFSEEGNCDGLGWLDATTQKFSNVNHHQKMKIPHMGWNNNRIMKESRILNGINEDDTFYFVHSYRVICNKENDILTSTHYFIDFHSSLLKENIVGVQFHPEKSFGAGLMLLKNFSEWEPNV